MLFDYTNAQKASTTQAGFLTEIAIASEVNTGTDATRAISPDSLAGSNYGKRVVEFIVVVVPTTDKFPLITTFPVDVTTNNSEFDASSTINLSAEPDDI